MSLFLLNCSGILEMWSPSLNRLWYEFSGNRNRFLMLTCKCLANNGPALLLARSPNKCCVSRKQILNVNIPTLLDSNSNYWSECARGPWGIGQLISPLNYLEHLGKNIMACSWSVEETCDSLSKELRGLHMFWTCAAPSEGTM